MAKRVKARPAPRRPGHSIRPTIDPDGETLALEHDDGESPLAWLYRRRGRDGRTLITAEEFAAGERLRADFTRARLGGLTSNWRGERVSGGRGGAEDLGGAALAARRRLAVAMQVVGPGLNGVLLDVCCFLKGLEQVEMERQLPPRAAKVVLKYALERLVLHYGPPPQAEGPGRAAGRTWRSPDTPVPPVEPP